MSKCISSGCPSSLGLLSYYYPTIKWFSHLGSTVTCETFVYYASSSLVTAAEFIWNGTEQRQHWLYAVPKYSTDWACVREDFTQPHPLPQSVYINTYDPQAGMKTMAGAGQEFNYLHFVMIIGFIFPLSERFKPNQKTSPAKALEAWCWRGLMFDQMLKTEFKRKATLTCFY